jgi:hypothetical protein
LRRSGRLQSLRSQVTMTALKFALVMAAAALLSGCCCLAPPDCNAPKTILDVSPSRIQGACRPAVNKSWGCGNSYNCAGSSTQRLYM